MYTYVDIQALQLFQHANKLWVSMFGERLLENTHIYTCMYVHVNIYIYVRTYTGTAIIPARKQTVDVCIWRETPRDCESCHYDRHLASSPSGVCVCVWCVLVHLCVYIYQYIYVCIYIYIYISNAVTMIGTLLHRR